MDFGLLKTIHQADSSADFSKILVEKTGKYYGTAAIAFLERLIQSSLLSTLPERINQLVNLFIQENLPLNASGQVHRVCERFALIAAGGELATQLHITAWAATRSNTGSSMLF